MSLQQHVIQPEELEGVGVIGMADTPGLTATAMQAKMEETTRQVVIPHFNAAMTEAAAALEARPTAETVQQLLTEQVLASGAGDMARVIYDPAQYQRDVFAAADAENIGMVRLCDTPDAEQDAAGGLAATPAAVQTALQAAADAAAAAQAAQTAADAAGTAAAAAQSTANAASTGATSANTNANTRMPIAGGTFTGNVAAYATNRNADCLRNAYVVNASGSGVSTNRLTFYRK